MEGTRGVKPPPARDHRLDAIRGMAIIGVPFSHTVRGLYAAGLVSPQSPAGVIEQQIACMIHLPLFVIATGLLMPASVDRQRPGHYLVRREISLLWPFLVWTALQGSIQVLTSNVKNQPTTWLDVVSIWTPIAQLWYLPFLMIATAIVVAIRPWQSATRSWIGLGVGATMSIAGWGNDGTTVLTRGMSLTIFLVVGTIIGRERIVRWWDRMPARRLLLTGVTALALGASASLLTPAAFPTSDVVGGVSIIQVACGALASGLLCFGVATTIAGVAPFASRLVAFLAYLGRYSMEIFLAHILVTAGTRIGLLRLGITDPLIHIVAGTTLGTLVPLVLVPVARVFPWLVAPPRALLPRTTGR